MAMTLADDELDPDERDDRPPRRRRRMWIVGVGFALLAVVVGLVLVRPWSSGDNDQSTDDTSVTQPSGSDSGGADSLAMGVRVAPTYIPEGLNPQWLNDPSTQGVNVDAMVENRSSLWVTDGATISDGAWLYVSVQLLDRFQRRSFDPMQFIDPSTARRVSINGLEGAFIDENFDGSSVVIFGPVLEGYSVTLSGSGIPEAQLLEIAKELELDERSDGLSADPVFGAAFVQLDMTLLSESTQLSFGEVSSFGLVTPFQNSDFTSFTLGIGSPTGEGFFMVRSVPVPPTFAFESVARFSLADATEVDIGGAQGFVGTLDVPFVTGPTVAWMMDGQLTVVEGDIDEDELIKVARSVEVLDDAGFDALNDTINQSQNFPGVAFNEPWLIDAGDLDDASTWSVEGFVDDDGEISVCAMSNSMSAGSSAGCSDSEPVTEPTLLAEMSVGLNGTAPTGVALVPVEMDGVDPLGFVLRFTGEDGSVVELPVHVVRPDWDVLAVAMAVEQSGTFELLDPSGEVVATATVEPGDGPIIEPAAPATIAVPVGG